MRHRAALPHVAVHPQAAIHCVDHPRSPRLELAIGDLALCFGTTRRVRRPHDSVTAAQAHRQAGTPSFTVGGGGDMAPMYTVHIRGYESGCVAVAIQPAAPGGAVSVMTTPGVPR
jgi:hypothetical protein